MRCSSEAANQCSLEGEAQGTHCDPFFKHSKESEFCRNFVFSACKGRLFVAISRLRLRVCAKLRLFIRGEGVTLSDKVLNSQQGGLIKCFRVPVPIAEPRGRRLVVQSLRSGWGDDYT